jgi:uncharacterized protein YjbI with pentapeptide repeats
MAFLVLALAACAKSSGTDTPRALTEHDFAADPALRLEPDQVGVTFLEAMDASSNALEDTGTLGMDTIPLVVRETGTYTYGLDPDDASGTIARVELWGKAGNGGTGGAAGARFTLTPASPSATVTLAPGEYDLRVYSGYTAAQETGPGGRTVFLRAPVEGTASPVMGTAGHPGVSTHASQADVARLLSTGSCKFCDLTKANLSGANLSGANLDGAKLIAANLNFANLTGAYLSDANLMGANLFRANLSGAYMASAKLIFANLELATLSGANLHSADLYKAIVEKVILDGATLSGANLSGANLHFSSLIGANLFGADLTGADLDRVNLSGADLRYANLSGASMIFANLSGANLFRATLSGAILFGATWTDGRTCAWSSSIGECK